MAKEGTKTITLNRKARHDYFIEDTYEAGISLAGTEVKSLRQGTVNLKDSYCIIKDGELFMVGAHISPYEKGNIFNKDPMLVQRDGYSLIPLSLYFKNARVKVELGLAKGKKLYDKRESAAKSDAAREIDRAMKSRRNG